MPHPVISMASEALGYALRVEGDIGLLDSSRRMLLASRGARHSNPGDVRIRALAGATRSIVQSGETLVVGANRLPWDAALVVCRDARGGAIVALENHEVCAQILPEKALRVWPEKKSARNKEGRLIQRDRLAGLLANCAYAVQLRDGGNMAMVKAEMIARGCPVKEWALQESPRLEAQQPAPFKPPEEFVAPPESISFNDRLTHFTREPGGPWPRESYVAYLRWLSSGPSFIPRNAFQSLRRILQQKTINACGRLVNSATPMVCFTQRDPSELLGENSWRKGLLRWTYSAYGVSFLKSDLTARGARRVRYISGDIEEVAPDDRCFLQIESSAGIDWRREEEWRVRGDLDFSMIDPSRIVAFVAHVSEAQSLAREFRIQALVIAHDQIKRQDMR